MSGKKDKAGTRICPLCAETVKADAPRCRACGSTLFAADLSFPGGAAAPAKSGKDDLEEALPVEGQGGDVGLAGVAAVVGALGTYGVLCWFTSGIALGAAVVAGAAATWAVIRSTRAPAGR